MPYSFLILSLLIISASSKEWKQWSCDEVTPNLCELHVEKGSVMIQSIPVHYWRYSRADKNDESNSSISQPIIALHGGPGWPHTYLLPLKQLACREDIISEVIFYDQAGCGKSIVPKINASTTTTTTPVQDEYPHLLDPAYYSEIELPTLIDHWKLPRYHILGHSWGTILAQLFALNSNATDGLQSLILSGPISNAKAYIDAQWDPTDTNNLASLPPFVQHRIHALEEENAYDTSEYKAIEEVLSTFFTMRTNPVPDCFEESAEGVNEEIYVGMQGASEFTIR